jgi:hypothetical protein
VLTYPEMNETDMTTQQSGRVTRREASKWLAHVSIAGALHISNHDYHVEVCNIGNIQKYWQL